MKKQKAASPSFTQVTPLSRFLALFLFLTFPIVGFFLGMAYQKAQSPMEFRLKYKEAQEAIRSTKSTLCNQDTKLCADGSSVGRSGPRCEFAACPGAK